MKKYLEILLALSFSSSLWAGATFSRAHNWVDLEVLTASDLNNEFNNILNNLDPAGVDDYSLTLSQMQTTVDPYPAAVESLATDLKGEIERLRYQVLQLKKSIQTNDSTYWYQDTPGQGTFTIGTSSVGVNNTSPSYSLDVVGTQRVTGNAIFSSSASIANTLVVSTITSTLPAVYITTHTSITGNTAITGNLTVTGSISNGISPMSIIFATTTAIQTITYNTVTQVIFGGEEIDLNSEFASNVFTSKSTGNFLVQVSLTWRSIIADKYLELSVRKNGVSKMLWTVFGPELADLTHDSFNLVVALNIGDTIDVTIKPISGSDSIELSNGYGPTTLYIQQLR